MSKQSIKKEYVNTEEIIGSETVLEKIKGKTPWIFGNFLRKPKINYPRIKSPRISLPMPSRSLNIIVVLIVLFVLQTGVVYFLVREPSALGTDANNNPMFIYPDISESFIIEGIVASMFIIFCSSGFILIYQASRYIYNKKMAVGILAMGIIMILITYVLLQYMLAAKLGRTLAELFAGLA